MKNVILKLRGMSCTSCARKIERAIQNVAGVAECNVNFGAKQASVSFDPNQTNLQTIQNAVDAAGYTAYLLPENQAIAHF